MRAIKTFENFSPDNYLWNDASFWIEELYPEEICFLSIYSKYIDDLNFKWWTKHRQRVCSMGRKPGGTSKC